MAVAVLLGVAFLLTGEDDAASDASAVQEVGMVTPEGELPDFTGEEVDPAVGMPAPALSGSGFDGEPVEFTPGEGPTALLFAAHWCPHCQREVEELAPWLADGGYPGVDVLTISTGVDQTAANYPPSAWFAEEGWSGTVMADSPDHDAATAYGLTGYPYFVFVDAEGDVVGRHGGALGVEALEGIFGRLSAR